MPNSKGHTKDGIYLVTGIGRETCAKCGIKLTPENIWPSRLRTRQVYTCKDCDSKSAHERWQRKDKSLETLKSKVANMILKSEVLCHYSDIEFPNERITCEHCGCSTPPYFPEAFCSNPFGQHEKPYTDFRALSIDHIDGSGAKHRKEIAKFGLYAWLKKNGYPEGYQVLCMNCQFIKRVMNHEWGRRLKQ